MDMLMKCKAILKDIYDSNLWENIPLRLMLIERKLEIDGSDEKAAQASSAILTFTELVKVMPTPINEILKLQNALVSLVAKNNARITNSLCLLRSEKGCLLDITFDI